MGLATWLKFVFFFLFFFGSATHGLSYGSVFITYLYVTDYFTYICVCGSAHLRFKSEFLGI